MSLTSDQVEEAFTQVSILSYRTPERANANYSAVRKAVALAVSILPDTDGDWDEDTVEVIAMAIAMNPLEQRVGSVTDAAKAVLAALTTVEPIDR